MGNCKCFTKQNVMHPLKQWKIRPLTFSWGKKMSIKVVLTAIERMKMLFPFILIAEFHWPHFKDHFVLSFTDPLRSSKKQEIWEKTYKVQFFIWAPKINQYNFTQFPPRRVCCCLKYRASRTRASELPSKSEQAVKNWRGLQTFMSHLSCTRLGWPGAAPGTKAAELCNLVSYCFYY